MPARRPDQAPAARRAATSRLQGVPPFARRVLDVVEAIPRGKVLAYGDIAAWLGEEGPRSVARVMGRYGDEVPWHRVLRSDGTCAPEVALRQLPLLRAEGVPFGRTGERVRMAEARWDPRERWEEPR
jgi:alkylated DNA nucleotide flippase Atl1